MQKTDGPHWGDGLPQQDADAAPALEAPCGTGGSGGSLGRGGPHGVGHKARLVVDDSSGEDEPPGSTASIGPLPKVDDRARDDIPTLGAAGWAPHIAGKGPVRGRARTLLDLRGAAGLEISMRIDGG